MKPRTPVVVGVVALTAAAVATVAGTASAQPAAPLSAAAAAANAASSAASLVASKPAYLHAGANEAFVKRQVITSGNLHYVSYDRTYKGLPVVGGDMVVMTDSAGAVKATSVAQKAPIGNLAVTTKVTAASAAATAKKQLKTVQTVEGTKLVVLSDLAAPKLAWETTVAGTSAEGPSRLTVDVDAATGAVLRKQEHVIDATGTGTGWVNGAVSLNTTQSGSTYTLKDPNTTNLSCQDAANNTTFSGPDNVWGNGVGTSKETGCVDALYIAETQKSMLSSWLGRNGQDGSGGAWPLRVGLADENAYYDGTQVQIGHNTANQWITSADVVGHELGHGIDDHTPGSLSGKGTQEFVADTFGAATEWYANNPNDPPDFQVGEEVNLVGTGPIRYMYNPSLAGDDNCYSSSTSTEEVHAAAGPGNHWFYLLAEGTNPTNGQPTSPTCNSSAAITGVGIQNAIKIMYNAMLLKTTASSYLNYRVWTLTAAKNLTPGDCTLYNTTKAAWNAVSVPAQSSEPACTGGTTPPTTTPTTTPPTTTPTTPPGGGSCTGTNGTDVSIPDAGPAVTSTITIAGCSRAPSATSKVEVHIVHTYRGDLVINLLAPNGTSYRLKNSSGSDGTDNVDATYTVNVSSQTANGAWKLQVQDVFSQDSGYLNTWTLTL